MHITDSVDSISRDGRDTPVYIIHNKKKYKYLALYTDIMESVDFISGDGPDTPTYVHVIHNRRQRANKL